MSKDNNFIAIMLAVLAAALYAISTPVSKMLLQTLCFCYDHTRHCGTHPFDVRFEDMHSIKHLLAQ